LRRTKQCLGILALMAFAAAIVGAGAVPAATQPRTKAQWQAAIAHVPEPGTGCYHASYPALQWHAVKCVAAPKFLGAPALPSRSVTPAVPAMVGGSGSDYSAKVSGLISQATGTFQDVSPNITEKGKVDNTGSEIANALSLQLNTQFFSGSPACSHSGDPASCQGWQQFLYNYSNSTGYVFMQYWLINYDATCPAGWMPGPPSLSGSCVANSPSSPLAGGPLTAKDLATVQLSGSAASGGKDKVSLSVGSGQATLVTGKDSVLSLAKFWNTAEWGVFGDGGSGEAYFGTGTTLEAQTALTATSSATPRCVKEDFTGETNNLNLTGTPALGSEPSPTVASKQTNGTTGTASCAVASASSGTWGKAKEVPGSAALNSGGAAQITSVSCTSVGNCSAGGGYFGSGTQAFVVDETNGTWGTARELSGNTTDARIDSLSCTSAGNCSAGGWYYDSSANRQAFVADETNGTWGSAKEVPGTATLNQGGYAQVNSVSCGSAGNCSAGGYYLGRTSQEAFVVNETNGTWGSAEEAPGTATLNQGGTAAIDSLSCTSAGNCSAGGQYEDGSSHYQAFVANETKGIWDPAEEVPGTAALNTGGQAGIASVSCTSAGNCSAGGSYAEPSSLQAFVVNETNGAWATAREVPGTAALNKAGQAAIASVSCTSAGNCSAGGSYSSSYIGGGSFLYQAFVVNEINGTWKTAEEVPHTAFLNNGDRAVVESVSCSSAGNCSAGGSYTDGSNNRQAFIVNESNGTWGPAEELPGTSSLNQGGDAGINSMSCVPAGNCSAGGWYRDISSNYQAFIVNRN
jgi:hypothetical protein